MEFLVCEILILIGLIMVWIPGIDIDLVRSLPKVTDDNYFKVNTIFQVVGGSIAIVSMLTMFFILYYM